jgi:hypothetical protein
MARQDGVHRRMAFNPAHKRRKRMDRFSYYMIRIRHSTAAERSEPLLAGVVERLGVGEKRSFTDGEELLRLLGGWMQRIPNMGSETDGASPNSTGADR